MIFVVEAIGKRLREFTSKTVSPLTVSSNIALCAETDG
jgi:hypothetical protein